MDDFQILTEPQVKCRNVLKNEEFDSISKKWNKYTMHLKNSCLENVSKNHLEVYYFKDAFSEKLFLKAEV